MHNFLGPQTMSKEEAKKFLKFQTCVLKLNICCDGCKKKVRRVLHKIEGVYAVTVDVEERKVTVTGSVDPVTLIKKLNKAGKNAELWPAKGGGNLQNLPGMLQKAQLEHGKGQQKPQKGGGGGGGIKEQKFQQQQGQGKGLTDLKFPSLKDLKLPFKKDDDKKVKFNLHPKGDFDGGSDYGDEDEDFDYDDDDEDYEDFDDMYDEFGGGGMLGDPKMMAKPSPMVNFNQPNAKGKKGGGGGKGGDLVQVPSNVVGGKNGGGGGNPNQANCGGRKGHGADESKNGGGNNKNKGGAQGNHGNPSPNKGGGGGSAGVGLGRGLPMVQPNMMMGQMGSFPATTGGMPHPGYFPPAAVPVPPEMMMAGGNPYQQQQYLQALMQHQQQQRLMMMNNGPDRQPPAFSPMQMGYGYGHGYGRPVYAPPPPPPPSYPHMEPPPYSMFSDENPNSCSVM